jgi:hypothetical protein
MNKQYQVLVIGNGKLAKEILDNLKTDSVSSVISWNDKSGLNKLPVIVVHAGSGRELGDAISFCSVKKSLLIELSTSSHLETEEITFPAIVCPNVNILILKFMLMMKKCGHLFEDYNKAILESHQSSKTSKPGTAINLAESLGLREDEIKSVRDPDVQEKELGIPPEHLARHAYHRIEIAEKNVTLKFEAMVFGQSAYANGLGKMIEGITGKILEPRLYDVLELVEHGWV